MFNHVGNETGKGKVEMVKFDKTKLKELRDMKGFNEADAASAIGATKQQWSDWESGKFALSMGMLEKICNTFDCDPRYFFVDEKAA